MRNLSFFSRFWFETNCDAQWLKLAADVPGAFDSRFILDHLNFAQSLRLVIVRRATLDKMTFIAPDESEAVEIEALKTRVLS